MHPSTLSTTLCIGHYESPIGVLEVRGSDTGVFSIKFIDQEHSDADVHSELQDCMDRIQAYFAGEKDAFVGLALAIHAADFQLSVLEELMKIPYGETVTYGEIAERIESPKAVRAVGTAVGNNPLALILPCHRVVPASSKKSIADNNNQGAGCLPAFLGNYRWGPWRKEWLLKHEQSLVMESL